MESGVDSLGAVELRNQLQRAAADGVALSSTLMFDHLTARQLALHLQGSQPAAARASTRASGAAAAVAVRGLSAAAGRRRDARRAAPHEPLRQRRAVRDPATRWDVEQAAADLFDSPPEVASRVRHGGFMRGAELFEHGSFGISAAEASAMDPQQRQPFERGYTALHAAGGRRGTLLGAVVAVNVGQWASELGSLARRRGAACTRRRGSRAR